MADFALSYMSARRECPDLTTIDRYCLPCALLTFSFSFFLISFDRLNIPADAMDFHYRHWTYSTPAHAPHDGHAIGSIDEAWRPHRLTCVFNPYSRLAIRLLRVCGVVFVHLQLPGGDAP